MDGSGVGERLPPARPRRPDPRTAPPPGGVAGKGRAPRTNAVRRAVTAVSRGRAGAPGASRPCRLGRDGVSGPGVVAVEGRQHGRPVGGDGNRRVERVRERSPPRNDFAHHDRGEWRLAEGHRQSHSEISGAFLLVLNWRPSDPVDDVELDHTDSTTWRGTEPRSRRAWPERSTFWAPVSEESGRNMPQQLLRAPF